MFTGIIRHRGTITDFTPQDDNATLHITCPDLPQLTPGDSIAVNGACLTVIEPITDTDWTHHVMVETLRKTSLGQLTVGHHVNLELPLTATAHLDGHFVLGHVDGTCTITDITAQGDDKLFTFRPPSVLMPHLVPKGSVALDGVSLTVVDVNDESFTVSFFPHTLTHTTFGQAEAGYQCNIETDILGKYVERLINHRNRH